MREAELSISGSDSLRGSSLDNNFLSRDSELVRVSVMLQEAAAICKALNKPLVIHILSFIVNHLSARHSYSFHSLTLPSNLPLSSNSPSSLPTPSPSSTLSPSLSSNPPSLSPSPPTLPPSLSSNITLAFSPHTHTHLHRNSVAMIWVVVRVCVSATHS